MRSSFTFHTADFTIPWRSRVAGFHTYTFDEVVFRIRFGWGVTCAAQAPLAQVMPITYHAILSRSKSEALLAESYVRSHKIWKAAKLAFLSAWHEQVDR